MDACEALAVRFAAKEATSKALGTGIGPIAWREVETLHKWSGEPYLVLHGAAEKIANELGLVVWAAQFVTAGRTGLLWLWHPANKIIQQRRSWGG